MTESTKLPGLWKRISVVLLLAGLAAGASIWQLKIQMQTVPQAVPSKAKVTAYGCLEDSPLPKAESLPLVEATEKLGLDFAHTAGPLGSFYVPESVGSGGAWSDFDGDGRLDLLLVNGGRSPGMTSEFPAGTRMGWALYRGTTEGTLAEIPLASELQDPGYGMGCTVADIDNDGDPDVYVTCVKQDRLLLNEGSFHFRDVAVAAGISESEWGTGASFFDYDRDGLLDLIVVNYTHDSEFDHQVACGFRAGLISYCGPHKFAPTIDRLYHNEGLSPVEGSDVMLPHFSDVTETAGLSGVTTYGFTVIATDLTGDGWPDMLIANDGQPNRFWVNQQNGTFIEDAVARGIAYNGAGATMAGMGIAVGDIDRNQTLDLVITNLSTQSTVLYLNDGQGSFVDNTLSAGLTRPTFAHTGWGAALIDLDHDGWLDLPMVHGLVIPCHSGFAPHGEDVQAVRTIPVTDPVAYWRDYADRNLLMMSTGSVILREATNDQGGDFTRADGSARCLLYGDPDEDGDLDLLVTNSGSRARYYRNDFQKLGHWIRLRLLTGESRRDAIGARVTVECGEDRWTSAVVPCSSYLAHSDVRVHLGLGSSTLIDQIVVHWPDGTVEDCVEVFPGGPVDQDRQLERGQGMRKRDNP